MIVFKKNVLYSKTKYVNFVPLDEDQVKLDAEKINRFINQRNFMKEFIFYTLFVIVFYSMSFYNWNNYSNEYRQQLDKLFSIESQAKSVFEL